MRIFFWSVIFSTIILFGFVRFAAPILEAKNIQPSYKLPVHKTLYLERSIYDEEFLSIVQASIEWNEVTNGQVTFDIKRLPDSDIDIHNAIIMINVSTDYPEVILLDARRGLITLGFFNHEASLAYIALVSERINEGRFTQIVLHELGHSLGLEHVDDVDGLGTLMYPTIDLGSMHITQTDLKQFCKLYHCDSSKFHGFSEIQ